MVWKWASVRGGGERAGWESAADYPVSAAGLPPTAGINAVGDLATLPTRAVTGDAMRQALGVCVAAVGIVLASQARAAIYRCQTAGKLVYTDRPCTPNAATATLPPLGTVPATPRDGPLVRQYDHRTAAEAKGHEAARRAWLQDYDERRARRQAIEHALAEGDVVTGMTPAQVESAWGEAVQRTGTDRDPRRWTYVNGRQRRVVEFSDGVVQRVHKGAAARRGTRHQRRFSDP
ncbi:MAG TPA: DUF4124 domain-containing protein [Nevskiaceae bacterium]|nr:DUF4124 domain-containing protein [Nevskiaceae bacterium]